MADKRIQYVGLANRVVMPHSGRSTTKVRDYTRTVGPYEPILVEAEAAAALVDNGGGCWEYAPEPEPAPAAKPARKKKTTRAKRKA